MTRTLLTRFMVMLAALALLGSMDAQAQQLGPPPSAGTEIGNFGDLPFRSPVLVLARPDHRAEWRKLEDKHIKELREFEDRYAAELRTVRQRQAEERDALLRTFGQ